MMVFNSFITVNAIYLVKVGRSYENLRLSLFLWKRVQQRRVAVATRSSAKVVGAHSELSSPIYRMAGFTRHRTLCL